MLKCLSFSGPLPLIYSNKILIIFVLFLLFINVILIPLVLFCHVHLILLLNLFSCLFPLELITTFNTLLICSWSYYLLHSIASAICLCLLQLTYLQQSLSISFFKNVWKFMNNFQRLLIFAGEYFVALNLQIHFSSIILSSPTSLVFWGFLFSWIILLF